MSNRCQPRVSLRSNERATLDGSPDMSSLWLHHVWTSTTAVQVCEFMMHVLLSVWRHCFNWRGCLTSCSTGPYLWWQKCAKNDDWCLVMFQRTCNWTWLCSLPRRWHETTCKQSEENKRRKGQLMQVPTVGDCFWWFLWNRPSYGMQWPKTLFCNCCGPIYELLCVLMVKTLARISPWMFLSKTTLCTGNIMFMW